MAQDVYSLVQSQILGELAKGKIPWLKPWKSNLARSYTTGRPYSLINQLMLGGSGEYITWNKCKELGGNVRKGAKAKMVVFWKMLKKSEKDEETGEEKVKMIPYLRYYNVFNVNDCEGLKAHEVEAVPFTPDENADEVMADYLNREGIEVSYGGDSAYYRPSNDSITLPEKEMFVNTAEFYSCAFHELTHSTGVEKRLNRDMSGFFGNEQYAKEELIAEMGSAFVCGTLGIDTADTIKNSAAYIQSWSKRIAEDKYLVVSACGKAEKACEFILGNAEAEEEEEGE